MPSARRCLENSPFSALESRLARVCEAFAESSQDEIYGLLWEIGSNALKYGVGVEMDSGGLADSEELANSADSVMLADSGAGAVDSVDFTRFVNSMDGVDSGGVLQTSESTRFLDSALETSAGKITKSKAESRKINQLEITLHIPKILPKTSPALNTTPAPNPRAQNPNSQNLDSPNLLLPNPPFAEIIFLYFTPARFCNFRAPDAPHQTTSHAPQKNTRTPPPNTHTPPPCPLLHAHDLATLHTPRPLRALDSHHNGLGSKVIKHFETIFCYDTPKVFIHSPTKRALRVRIKGAYLAYKHGK